MRFQDGKLLTGTGNNPRLPLLDMMAAPLCSIACHHFGYEINTGYTPYKGNSYRHILR